MIIRKSPFDFETSLKRLEESISKNRMAVVSRINAQERLRNAGFQCEGNFIFEIFRPDYANKVFRANLRAGIEPPLRIYVYESNHEVYVEYYEPSEIFSKWGLQDLGRELDRIFQSIVDDALSS
jgi:uncharacterized protein (DUF302 family)